MKDEGRRAGAATTPLKLQPHTDITVCLYLMAPVKFNDCGTDTNEAAEVPPQTLYESRELFLLRQV